MYDAVGATFLAQDTKRIIFNLRSTSVSHSGKWSFWGGKLESGETPIQALKREISEEVGFVPEILKIQPLDVFLSDDKKFMYHTFVIITPTEFTPKINHESTAFRWCKINNFPEPLHQGARKTLFDKNNVKKLNTIVNSIE
jgi:8-oxo-dGTP diphosphatase